MSIYEFLVQHFSYGILFLWSILEGEIGLALAGFLAHEGSLRYEYIVIIAVCGALLGDVALFLTGYFFKNRVETWLHNYERKVQRIWQWFERYGVWVIIFERFIYGTHIPALLVIGMSGLRFGKFLFFDILGVIFWAVSFTALGYFFGQDAIDLLSFFQRHLSIIILLALFGLTFWQFRK